MSNIIHVLFCQIGINHLFYTSSNQGEPFQVVNINHMNIGK